MEELNVPICNFEGPIYILAIEGTVYRGATAAPPEVSFREICLEVS